MPLVVRQPCSCRSTCGDCSARTVGANGRPMAEDRPVKGSGPGFVI
jgi:hypothetical protein